MYIYLYIEVSLPLILQDDSHEAKHKYAKAISTASYRYIIEGCSLHALETIVAGPMDGSSG